MIGAVMTDKPESKPIRKPLRRWLAILLAVAACWFVVRAFEYGLPNVFFRDHHFTDDRQLTEEVAVDLTRKTLEEEAFNVASMRPQPFWHNDPRVFARNTINPNNGYVLWGDRHLEQVTFIRSQGLEYKCGRSKEGTADGSFIDGSAEADRAGV
jgi:hypothetical protein